MKHFLLVILSFLWLQPLAFSGQTCRELNTQRTLRFQAGHIPAGNGTASIIRVVTTGAKTKITIEIQSSRSGDYFSNIFSTLPEKTIEWFPEGTDLPSNVGLTDRSLIEGRRSNVQYFYLDQVGRYVRSDNSGRSWVMPAYRVTSDIPILAKSESFGRVQNLEFQLTAISPSEPKTIYAALRIREWGPLTAAKYLPGLYRSVDGGETWHSFSKQLLSNIPETQLTPPLGISPRNQNLMFGVGPSGILRSVDGGKTWVPVGRQQQLQKRPRYLGESTTAPFLGAPVGLQVRQFVLHPTTENTLFVLTNFGILRSQDRGENWCWLNTDNDEVDAVNSIALDDSGNVLYFGSSFGVFRSHDAGEHFENIYPAKGTDDPHYQISLK